MANLHSIKASSSLVLVLSLTLSMSASAAQPDAAGVVVGEMITVIGMGKVLNTQGEQTAERGKVVRAGDRIETTAGGHVHVRFVDGALVSIRPLSRLHIEDYRNSDSNHLAAIKFRLEEGVIRSVTGQWGEAHRDRFRINTPVAAIGIKGTDFVLKANNSSTLATVNSGAIVMAPLEGSCASGLGPCSGERSALLTADMQGTMLEYFKQNDTSSPRLIPYVDLLARNNSSTQRAERRLADGMQSNASSDGSLVSKAPPNSTDAASKVIDTSTREPIVTADLPSTVTVTPTSPPMAWIHNVADWNVPANSISTRFSQATMAGRTPVVGNFFINLYRDEITPKGFTPPTETASFNLQSASANYVQPVAYGRPSETVTVSGASLAVDFARNTLTTHMDLSSPSMGNDRFVASTNITQQGIFTDKTASQQLAGAFSTDARQAGYLFEKSLIGGTVSGLTLWGR